MNQKGFANIILIAVIVILVGTVGYFAFVKKSEPVAQQPTPTQTTTPTKTPISPTPTPTPTPAPSQVAITKIVTLTSPKNGATYSQSASIRITGKTKPNYYIQVYANYPAKDLQCLTFNSFSNGGAGQADANGNFDFSIAYEGYKSGQNTLVVAALQNSRVENCFPANSVSDVVTYTYTGPVPNY